MHLDILKKKIKSRKVKVAIIGLGYVGLPLAIQILSNSFNVIGFDLDINKIKNLKQNKSYISTISDSTLKNLNKKNFLPTTSLNKLKQADIFIICVPTPLNNSLNPDLSYIESACKSISKVIKKGSMVVLESTTYPGCTLDYLGNSFSKNMEIGHSVFIGYSPEREDPGNKSFKTGNTPKIVSGISKNCLEIINLFYSEFINKTVKVSSTKTAEMVKLLENIYRSVNIGLINEMKIISDLFDLDIFEVINAASTKPFGFNAFYPGPGLGGHCIPVDPYYLSWKSKKLGYETKFIKLAGEINRYMPKYVFNKIKEVLRLSNKKLHLSNILIIGVAYKKNIEDTRETPAKDIIELLENHDINIEYHDPYVPFFKTKNKSYKSTKLNIKNFNKNDLTVILTNHDNLDYDFILKYSKKIIDTRGQYNLVHNNLSRG